MINVKNTIVKQLAEALSPHYCCSCGTIGSVLCESCKYDIVNEPKMVCFACKKPICPPEAVCNSCILPYSYCWTLGERSDSLEQLINVSKYESCRQGCIVQAELIHTILPVLPDNTIITSIPTINRHIRERGYDHAAKIAKHLAKLRKVIYKTTLLRRESSVQQGASRSMRLKQAAKAYQVSQALDDEKVYLLVDDVVTTGASLKRASMILLEGGAKQVWVVATAYQSQ